MVATIPLVARKGRASYLGQRSAGTQDPGATSSWLLLEAAAAAGRSDGAVIGLVLVSHSARLAEGAAELAAQMAGPDVRIAATGGLDQPGSPLGTDATLVAAAIERAWSPDGVLVLMDLGSAVLSAELALELLPPERRERVRLTAAPLVEGAVAAAVAAALGGTLDTVAGEARDGLAAKAAHLAAEARGGARQAPERRRPVSRHRNAAGEATLRLRIDNPLGLHARPAALFVRTAASFEATVTVEDVTVARGPVSARSLNAVATLGVARGHEIVVRARGAQAHEALAALARLAAAGFGEPPGERGPAATGLPARARRDGPAATGRPLVPPAAAMRLPAERSAAAPAPGAVLHGLPASPGIAIGPARRLQAAVAVEAPRGPGADPEAEWAALQRALTDTAADLTVARDAVAGRAGGYEAAIFDAHLLFLDDEALLGPARAAILESGDNAAAAWAASAARAAAAWQALDDPYLRARAADLREVADQVMRHLLGLPAAGPAAAGGIVVTSDLTPAAAAALDGARVRGVACAGGGPTSHGAILARALGLPAVVGCGAALLAVAEGTALLLDGEAGTVTVAPPPALLEAAEASTRADRGRRGGGAGRRRPPRPHARRARRAGDRQSGGARRGRGGRGGRGRRRRSAAHRVPLPREWPPAGRGRAGAGLPGDGRAPRRSPARRAHARRRRRQAAGLPADRPARTTRSSACAASASACGIPSCWPASCAPCCGWRPTTRCACCCPW